MTIIEDELMNDLEDEEELDDSEIWKRLDITRKQLKEVINDIEKNMEKNKEIFSRQLRVQREHVYVRNRSAISSTGCNNAINPGEQK